MAPRFVTGLLVALVVSLPVAAWAVEVGVALTLSHLLAMVVVATAGAVWWREHRRVPMGAAGVALLVFFLVAVMSVVMVQAGPDIQMRGESAHAKSIKQLVGLGFGLSVFAGLRSLMQWYGLAPRALRVHLWTTAAVATLALIQFGIASWNVDHVLANWPVHNSTLGATRPLSLMYGFPRVSLGMVEPSMLATYLMTGWAFWLFAWERRPTVTTSMHGLFTASGVVTGVAIITSGSRLVYVVAVSLAVAAILLRPNRLARGGLIAASVVVGLFLTGVDHSQRLMATLMPRPALQEQLPNLPPPTAARDTEPVAVVPAPAGAEGGGNQHGDAASPKALVDTLGRTVDDTMHSAETAVNQNDLSVQQRVASYLVTAVVVRERPWTGTGLGTSAFYMERYWPSTFPSIQAFAGSPVMMSHYGTVLTETGLPGMVCLVAFAAAVLVELWRAGRRSRDRWLVLGLTAALAGYALAGTATALVVYQSLLVWVLLAASLTLSVPEGAASRSSHAGGAR